MSSEKHNGKKFWGILLLLIFGILPVVFSPSFVSALSSDQIDAFNMGASYYDTEASSSACNNSVALVGGDNEAKVFNFFVSKGLPAFQAAGIVGNIAVESGFDPEIYQGDGKDHATPPGDLGWGIVQWTPPSKILNYAQSTGQPANDLGVQLEFLWAQLNGTASSNNEKAAGDKLNATTNVDDASDAFLEYYERAKDHTPGGPNSLTRRALAEQALVRYGGDIGASASSIDPSTGCASGAVVGNIVQTALNYAWPDSGHGPSESDATPAYQSAMPKYDGATTDYPFADCGVFVATVMIASGADPSYPKRSTTIQESYLKAHPELYQELPDPTDTSTLHPGDILINSTHTYIFVGQQSAGYNSVAASLGDHVPQASNFYPGFQAFRPLMSSSQGQQTQ